MKNKSKSKDILLVPHLSNHIFRHTFTTRLNEQNINTKAMQSILGHSDISTTMDIYVEVPKNRLLYIFRQLSKVEGIFPTMKPIGKEKSENEDFSKETDNKPKIEKIDFSKVKVEPLFEDMVDFDTFSKSDFRVVKVLNCEEVPKSKKLLKFTLDDGIGKERIILSGIKNFYNAEELVGKTLLAITNLAPRQMMGLESCGMLLSAVCEYEGEELLNLIMLDSKIPAGAKIY